MRYDERGSSHVGIYVGHSHAEQNRSSWNSPNGPGEGFNGLSSRLSGHGRGGIGTGWCESVRSDVHLLGRADRLPIDVVRHPELDSGAPLARGVPCQLQIEPRHDVREVHWQGRGDEQVDLIVYRLRRDVRRQEDSAQASGDERVQRLVVWWTLERLVARVVRQIVGYYGRNTILHVKIAAPVSVTAMVKCPPDCPVWNVH